jgi:pimeloyl-ACP methyl ester carboxylesterase
MERRLSSTPSITVPTVTLEGDADGVTPQGGGQASPKQFTGRHENRVVPNAGHNLPQEAPEAFASAILDVNAWAG